MPFISQYQYPDSITHSFSGDWNKVVRDALPGSDVLVPNKVIAQSILSKRHDLNVRSLHEVTTANISSSSPSKRCYWVQDVSQKKSPCRVSITSAKRHQHADAQGIWWNDVWIDDQRKFGIEIELTSHDFVSTLTWKHKEWRGRAGVILALLREALGESRVYSTIQHSSQQEYLRWQVVYDESVGWEIISPILSGREGIEELMTVMVLMKDFRSFGFVINSSTGMHIHLSWKESILATKKLLHWWRYLEPSMATLVHPSRVFAHHRGYFSKTYNNFYCMPLSQLTDGHSIQRADDVIDLCSDISRQTSINPHSIIHKRSVEFRFFESTSDPMLAMIWLSLCQQIACLAKDMKIPLLSSSNWDSTSLSPTGDVVLLCRTLLPSGVRHDFLNLLIHRRRQVAAHWCRNSSLHQWLPFVQAWRTTYTDSDSPDS